MEYTIKGYCRYCDSIEYIEMKEKFEKWMDLNIDDDELSQIEVISRMNGDITSICTCLNCNSSWEEL
ncbi:RING finger protein [Vibrio parahaemolyticus]|uniref:hypothetical protein n=1 Tax=Vibrio parahaemolyticus TaxID=670 RepID=UPI00047146C2|nr:hypothetical protein [Vibrio parahaemolyticus]EIF8962030.1 hypothetical protein [Vibrio parahaemolyticus]